MLCTLNWPAKGEGEEARLSLEYNRYLSRDSFEDLFAVKRAFQFGPDSVQFDEPVDVRFFNRPVTPGSSLVPAPGLTSARG